MKIKMNTTASGPNLNLQEGKTYDVSDEQGKAFIVGGYAIDVTPAPEDPAPEPETATVAAPEDATAAPQRKNTSTARGRR